MALLLWLCLAGVVLALLSSIAPALAAIALFKHAKRTANAPLFTDIERFDVLSGRFVRAADALTALRARVQTARSSVQASVAGLRFS